MVLKTYKVTYRQYLNGLRVLIENIYIYNDKCMGI
jgi:hypothetical protein